MKLSELERIKTALDEAVHDEWPHSKAFDFLNNDAYRLVDEIEWLRASLAEIASKRNPRAKEQPTEAEEGIYLNGFDDGANYLADMAEETLAEE